jgi:NAD(P)-dependent dehydrogenase (short-subunit alcohol dehydrogenase family)
MTGPAAPPPTQPADPVGGRTDTPPGAVPPVALVTGAARGVGAATVAALAADGWRVIAADVCADDPALPYSLGSRADLDRVAGAAGGDVVAWVADARDPRELAAAVGEA